MKKFILPLLFVAVSSALAAHPPVERLSSFDAKKLWSVENGSFSEQKDTLQWKVNSGQNSRLAISPEHPLFQRLRYYDRLQFEYRVASGAVSSIEFNALGHVSGPRQYKIHNQRVAIVTTPKEVWHRVELDLADAYWFPWDNPDGDGDEGFFRLDALAIEEGTVVELRNLRLVRGLIYLKPDFVRPVTMPLKKENEDGSATYTLDYKVLNTSGQPTTINAKIVSKHKHFQVSLDAAAVEVKSSKPASFQITATISKDAIAATSELYAEPLQLEFALEHLPEVTTQWSGNLVRPLSKALKKQVVLPQKVVDTIQAKVAAEDADFKKLIGLEKTVAAADDFVAKEFLKIPDSYGHVRNSYPRPWVPGDRMPEAVNTETGEKRFGDHIAGQVWREYLALSGQATYKTGLAYLLTGDEKYAKKAVELMELYGQQYELRPWFSLFDPPYHRGTPIQTSSRQASNSSYGSNWDFKWFSKMASMVAESPSLTPEAKEKIYKGFVRPFGCELMKLNAKISNQTDITNHDLFLLGLVFDDATLVHTGLLRDCGLISRLKDIDDDGFSSEGRPLNYHHAAADEDLPTVTYLENSGLKIDYGKRRILNAIRMPFQRATLTGVVPNAGDCGRGQMVRANNFADMLISIAPEEKWLQDVGRGSTLEAKIQRLKTGFQPDRYAWMKALETQPRLFSQAGLAILRTGDTPETQVMLTLDYGRSVFHNALDRNQITLSAFGKIYTHGTGSLYNAGRGGITFNEDPKMKSFIRGSVSLSNNVLVVDKTSQRQCVGKLLAWSDKPDYQVAVTEVGGIAPGVTHTRGVVLSKGVVVMFDEIESKDAHNYDLVYHNFGTLKPDATWIAKPTQPLGSTGNFDNIKDPQQLNGKGLLQATWDLTEQVPPAPKPRKGKQPERTLEPAHLNLWQSAPKGTSFYTGLTGLNNTNTRIMADETPTIISRIEAKSASFVTILEPYKEESAVKSVNVSNEGQATITLKSGDKIEASLKQILKAHGI